ncbi:MAG: DJ-1/PfpI family protein [Synergistaceae bacterium]|jgi:putative intracellular protease/amidase|nr:DJ-1/PfpI family protein [Synergistaceae bacterium]
METTDVDVLLFDGFETLDAMGPVEVFGRLPEHYRIVCRSIAGGTVTSSQGVAFVTAPFPAGAPGRVLLIPGGMGTRSLVRDAEFLAALKRLCESAEYVLTVCTGSALLAKTGMLDGRRATTNKAAFGWASSQGEQVRWEKRARWVADGKYRTSSGVAAGIDMTLGFLEERHGRNTALEAAKQIEYLWNGDRENDPFAAGL